MSKIDFGDVAPLRLHRPAFERLKLTLVGCGGTGSHLASGLVTLMLALQENNIATDALFIDPDHVELKNVGRQLFGTGDVGGAKAIILARRLNNTFGLAIGSSVRLIDDLDTFTDTGTLNIVIGAVDNTLARVLLAEAVRKAQGQLWWLDTGNENHSGQVALGNITATEDMNNAAALGMADRLPAPNLVYPDLIMPPAPKKEKRKRAENCADALATGEQGLMVNRMVAAWALAMLHDFLFGELRYFAIDFDLAWGGTHVHALDAKTLKQFEKGR